MIRFTEILNNASAQREHITLCTVVETSGSTPLKAGAKMLVWENGRCAGTIGGGNIEKKVIEIAIATYQSGRPKLEEYALLKEKMCCGGSMKIFIEPMKPRKQLIIFGAGHIGSNISYFADKLDFEIVIVDERKEYIRKIQLSEVTKFNLPHQQAFSKITFDSNTYIVICTHSHDYDREILALSINQPHAYLGMIGSLRKVLVTRKLFLQQNITTQGQLNEVDMPMGYDIGQHSPAEIALGIVAKIVARSNDKYPGQAGSDSNHTHEADIKMETCLTLPLLHGA